MKIFFYLCAIPAVGFVFLIYINRRQKIWLELVEKYKVKKPDKVRKSGGSYLHIWKGDRVEDKGKFKNFFNYMAVDFLDGDMVVYPVSPIFCTQTIKIPSKDFEKMTLKKGFLKSQTYKVKAMNIYIKFF